MRFVDIPVRAPGVTSVSWWNSLRTAGVALAAFFGEGAISETSLSLVNGQAVALALTGLSFDSADYSSVRIEVEINQKTDSAELISTGQIMLFWRALTSTWDIIAEFEGDESGATFTVPTTGTVGDLKYTLGTLAGSGYVGKFKFKAMTFGA